MLEHHDTLWIADINTIKTGGSFYFAEPFFFLPAIRVNVMGNGLHVSLSRLGVKNGLHSMRRSLIRDNVEGSR